MKQGSASFVTRRFWAKSVWRNRLISGVISQQYLPSTGQMWSRRLKPLEPRAGNGRFAFRTPDFEFIIRVLESAIKFNP